MNEIYWKVGAVSVPLKNAVIAGTFTGNFPGAKRVFDLRYKISGKNCSLTGILN
jgi:hypothetical protein